jgi:hypothetical protein
MLKLDFSKAWKKRTDLWLSRIDVKALSIAKMQEAFESMPFSQSFRTAIGNFPIAPHVGSAEPQKCGRN